MKTLGLIGGMSWESTLPYYRRINELATDTMHKVAPAIEAAVDIPLLHVADSTAAAIERGTRAADFALGDS